MREPSLFSPPDPASTQRLLVLAVAVLGALLAHPALADHPMVVEQTKSPGAWLVVAGWTAVASVVHMQVASGAGSVGTAVLRSAALGILLGIMDSALSLGTITFLREGRIEEGFTGFFMGGFFGAPVGALTGLAFGLGYAPLVALVVDQRRAPTHESRDHAWMAIGIALGIAALLREGLLPEPAGVQVLAALGGVGCFTIGAIGAARRRLFVARVRAGRVADWAIDVLPEVSPSLRLLPATGGSAPSVLYRAADLGSGPYRASSGWTPVARIGAPAPR